jgi:hypothetical protein
VQFPGVQAVVFGYVSSGHAGCGTSARPVVVITPELPGPVGKQGVDVLFEQQSWLMPPLRSTQTVAPVT